MPVQTGYVYDGDGRVIRQISYSDGDRDLGDRHQLRRRLHHRHPARPGGTAADHVHQRRGPDQRVYQYHAGVARPGPSDPAADYDQTSYTYTPAGQLADITDAAGNTWSYSYDLAGDQTSAADPDAGTTTSTYDPAGQLIIDHRRPRQDQSRYTYDADGRKTAEYDTTGGAAETSADELASWTYDTLAKGQLDLLDLLRRRTAAYTEAVTGYNSLRAARGRPRPIIPSAQGDLAGTYTADVRPTTPTATAGVVHRLRGRRPARRDGRPPATTPPASPDSPDRQLGPTSTALSYTDLGQPLRVHARHHAPSRPRSPTPTTSRPATSTQQNTQTGTSPVTVDDLNYSYDNDGQITSEADTPPAAAAQVQCFQLRLPRPAGPGLVPGQRGLRASARPSIGRGRRRRPTGSSYSYNDQNDLTGETSTPPQRRRHHHHRHLPRRRLPRSRTPTASSRPPARRAPPPPPATATTPTATSPPITSRASTRALTWNDARPARASPSPPPAAAARTTSYIYDAERQPAPAAPTRHAPPCTCPTRSSS